MTFYKSLDPTKTDATELKKVVFFLQNMCYI